MHLINPPQNEIHFYELWLLIKQGKKTVFLTIFITTFSMFVYLLTVKPIYRTSMLIELGEVILNYQPNSNKPTMIVVLETPSDLQIVLHEKMKALKLTKAEFKIFPPEQDDSRIIKIELQSNKKDQLQKNYNTLRSSIIQRHEEKVQNYAKMDAIIEQTYIQSSSNVSIIYPSTIKYIGTGLIGGALLGIFWILLSNTFTRSNIISKSV